MRARRAPLRVSFSEKKVAESSLLAKDAVGRALGASLTATPWLLNLGVGGQEPVKAPGSFRKWSHDQG